MPLVIGLVALAGAILLLTSGITDASFADVITGKAGQIYRANQTPTIAAAAAAAASTTSTGASSSSSTSTATGSPPSGSGPFSYDQLKSLWTSAGGSAAAAPIAAAVALAESSGDPNSHATVGEDSRGLWQINVAPSANPQYASQNLYDPATNAKIAVQMSGNGSNWQPWTTYTSGRYLQFLGH